MLETTITSLGLAVVYRDASGAYPAIIHTGGNEDAARLIVFGLRKMVKKKEGNEIVERVEDVGATVINDVPFSSKPRSGQKRENVYPYWDYN